tara:strand:- start:75 stop:260 length:186 start_codon:yes stop_codon:yes gene_type:complete
MEKNQHFIVDNIRFTHKSEQDSSKLLLNKITNKIKLTYTLISTGDSRLPKNSKNFRDFEKN